MHGLIANELTDSNIEDVEIEFTGNSIVNYDNSENSNKTMGILAGSMKNGTLSNNTITINNGDEQQTGKIIIKGSTNINNFGSFVGKAESVEIINNTLEANIDTCSNEGYLDYICSNITNDTNGFGGIAGFVDGGNFNNNTFKGSLTINARNIIAKVGGLIGSLKIPADPEHNFELSKTQVELNEFNLKSINNYITHAGGLIGVLDNAQNNPAPTLEKTSVLIKNFTIDISDISSNCTIYSKYYAGMIGRTYTQTNTPTPQNVILKNVQSAILNVGGCDTKLKALIGDGGSNGSDTNAGKIASDSENILSFITNKKPQYYASDAQNSICVSDSISNAYRFAKDNNHYISLCSNNTNTEVTPVQIINTFNSNDNPSKWETHCYKPNLTDAGYTIPLFIKPPVDWGFITGSCP